MRNLEDIDSFWDIEKLVPPKNSIQPSRFSTKEKTVTVNVEGYDNDNSEQRKLTLTEKDEAVSELDRVYYPSETLVKKVIVKHIPDKFDFHANFVKAAELYYDFNGTECEFVQFYSYMPQYTQLSQTQRNYYFYWRTMFRHGKYLKTDYSYLYLYVYEILNLPNRISGPDGLKLLVTLWKVYRKELPNIDLNMSIWVQDYCLVNGLSAPIAEISDFIFDIMSVTKFKEFYFSGYEKFGADGVGALIAYLSDYDWRRGKYAGGENREAYKRHIMGAMSAFIKEMMETNAFGMNNGQISTRVDNSYRMALTTCPIKYRITVEYRKISEEPEVRLLVTSALKYTENKLRALLGVKSRLAVKDFDESYAGIIDSYFEKLFREVNRERMKANRPEYEKLYEAKEEELSLDGADEIERASWITTARLVVEEETENEETVEKEEQNINCSDDADKSDCYGLTSYEIEFVSMALSFDNEKIKMICQRMQTFPDAVADRINEAFADNFGDVILEDNGEGYTVITDYREDVENWLSKITK